MPRARPRMHLTLDPRIIEAFRDRRALSKLVDAAILPLVQENGHSDLSLLEEYAHNDEEVLRLTARNQGILNQLRLKGQMALAPRPGPPADLTGAVAGFRDLKKRWARIRASKEKREAAFLVFCKDRLEGSSDLRARFASPGVLRDYLVKETAA